MGCKSDDRGTGHMEQTGKSCALMEGFLHEVGFLKHGARVRCKDLWAWNGPTSSSLRMELGVEPYEECCATAYMAWRVCSGRHESEVHTQNSHGFLPRVTAQGRWLVTLPSDNVICTLKD
jgi:hypothetical protein